jgi:hypothetical protein
MMKWLNAGLRAAVLAISTVMSFAKMNVAEINGAVADPAGGFVRERQ